MELVIVDSYEEMWLRRGEHKNSAGGLWYGIEVKEVVYRLPVGEASCFYEPRAPSTGPGTQ